MASIRKYRTGGGAKRWEVRWRDGRRRDKCKTFPAERDAKRFRTEIERKQQLGVLYDAPAETFGEFLDGWLERYETAVRPSTYARAVEALRHVRVFAPLYVHELKASDVDDHIKAVAKTAPRQAQMALAKLKQALANAKDREQVVDERIFRLAAPKHEERVPRFLTWDEVEHLASHCAEGRMVVIAALTGIREGELFALRATSIDLQAGAVVVESGAYRGQATRTKTRNGRRRVYLSQLAAQTLREQLLARKPNDLDLVFPSPRGGIWHADNFMGRVFRPAVKRSGFDGLTFHDLRHTCASLMIKAGANPLEIAAQFGHADARLILQRYGHLYPGASQRAVSALDDVTGSSSDVGEAWGEA
jgi:integrase